MGCSSVSEVDTPNPEQHVCICTTADLQLVPLHPFFVSGMHLFDCIQGFVFYQAMTISI